METIATTCLVSVSLLPVLTFALRGQAWSWKLAAYVALVAGVGGTMWAAQALRPSGSTEAAVKHRPIQAPDDGYVSSSACRACHPQYHATWHHSYHRKMTQLATASSIVGDFNKVRLQRGAADYRLTREADEFFVEIHDSDRAESTRKQRVVMTTGSHHRQWVWMETGDTRKLEPLPFIYLISHQRWIPLESSFLVPPDLDLGFRKGAWNENCIQCHTTQGRMRKQYRPPNVVEMDTRVGEFGIACESCHGPAEQHILANRDPLRRYRLRTKGEPDPTMVNPAHLSAELSAHVCGQCHAALSLYKSKNLATYNRWNNSGFDFRPGRDLRDSRYLFGYPPHMNSDFMTNFMKSDPTYVPNRFWSDGVIRVAGREFSGLLVTPCFTHGDPSKQMSCLSCHAMHQPDGDERPIDEWANDQLRVEMTGNQACTQCHQDYAGKGQLEAHTHHAASSTGSLCYNCHMPYTTFGLLKAIRSHAVISPSVQSSLETGRPNACNQCHLDRTLAWSADYLHRWHDVPQPELTDDQRSISASVLWSLQGDAGQRALMAWSMGWTVAREASGTDWMAPYLAELLKDPYDAVRFVAHESLRKAGELHDEEFDFLAPVSERNQVAQRLRSLWDQQPRADREPRESLLIDAQGQLQQEIVDRLLETRDHRPINLQE